MNWLSTDEMRKHLGISDKTLLSLKNHTSMFSEGVEWRRKGATARGPLQWNLKTTERAFTSWRRPDPSSIEVFSAEGN